ncbi:MAG: hypothetical protein ACRCWJ_15260 [Casimicrobium sp.]
MIDRLPKNRSMDRPARPANPVVFQRHVNPEEVRTRPLGALTFRATAQPNQRGLWGDLPLKSAIREVRTMAQNGHVAIAKPNRPLVGGDFAEYGDRILLGELGYFSCDLPKARAKRDRQAQIDAYIEQAYDVLNLDRKEQHALIAARLEAKRFDGIWARSTGEYAAACRRLDEAVIAASPAIGLSISELELNK